MISLRKAEEHLNRRDELLKAAEDYFAKIIRLCGDDAVEFDGRAAEDLRDELRSLESQFKKTSPQPEFGSSFDALRQRLDSYRSLGNEKIARMREDLKNATAAMRVFADSVSAGSSDYELQLRQQVQRLNGLAGIDDLTRIRLGIREVSEAILESHQQMDRSHRLVISQLRDEIRTLHAAMDAEKNKRATDQSSGAWNRQAITERIDALLASNQQFCVLLVGITNWGRIQAQHSPNARQSALRAFLGEICKFLGAEPTVGRWNEQLFLGVIQGSPASALNISGELRRKLPKSFTVREGGSLSTVKLEASIGVVDRREGTDSARFYTKLSQLADTLG